MLLKRIGLIIGVVLWIAAPITTVVVLSRLASEQTLTPAVDTSVAVLPNTEPSTSPVALIPTRGPAQPLVAPNFNGSIIQQTFLDTGTALTNGSPVVVVDDITRRAATTDRPFTSALQLGDRSTDVQMLNIFLSSLGYASGTGTTFTSTTERGVTQYALDNGAGRDQAVFDPNWVIFLPGPSFVVASSEIVIGAPSPSPGESLALSVPRVISVQVATSESAEQLDAQPSDDTAATAPLLQAVTVPPAASLLLNGTSLPLDDTRTQLSLDGIILFENQVPPNQNSTAALLQEPPVGGDFLVPPSAIFTDGSGEQCVVLTVKEIAINVEIVGSTFDNTTIRGDLKAGDQVYVGKAPADQTC